jgi:phytoene dehydrogenase-like protein
MSAKVIIIGAGITGLSTGCYAQMNGYHTKIFEMHDKPGGVCTTWQRKGYTIDGCLHYLTGTSPGHDLHRVWQELGALEGREIINPEQLYRFEEPQGRIFNMYCNIDRLEEHMLELSPPDAIFIRRLCKGLRQFTKFNVVNAKPRELSGIIDNLRMMVKIFPILGAFRRWGNLTLEELASRFSDPLLQKAWKIFHNEFSAMGFMTNLAWLHNQTAGYLIGGSLQMAQAIEKRYLGLGGKIIYKSAVSKIIVEAGRAVGIRLENGEEHRADYIISAADGHSTIFEILEGKYTDDTIRGYYEKLPAVPAILYIGLGVKRTFNDLPRMVEGLTLFFDKPLHIGGTDVDSFTTHFYNFDPTLAPVGKTTVVLMLDSDYTFWKSLRADISLYQEEKIKTAKILINILDKRFPGFADQVEMVDVATPVTFERYTRNWKGHYQGWMVTPKTLRMNIRKTLPGLEKFHMAGQWVSYGGLPTAALSGREVVQLLCYQDGKKFETSFP